MKTRSISLLFVSLILQLVLNSAFGEPNQPAVRSEDTAQQLVRRALQSEMEGNNRGRNVMLAKASKVAPHLAATHWHAGKINIDGQWTSIEMAQQEASDDPKRQRYRELREEAKGNAHRLLRLARWCDRAGLRDLSRLHYRQLLTSADTSLRLRALRKLGLKTYRGVLMTQEEIQAHREEAARRQQALNKWEHALTDWQNAIDHDRGPRRTTALQRMENVKDLDVIPALHSMAKTAGPGFGQSAVKLLGRFRSHEATEALVEYAVVPEDTSTRRNAIDLLRYRSLHDFVPQLLSRLTPSIESRWNISWDGLGNLRYRHVFYREGRETNQLLTADHLVVPNDDVVVSQERLPVPEGLRTTRPVPDVAPMRANRRARTRILDTPANRLTHALVANTTLGAVAGRERMVAEANERVLRANEWLLDALELTSGAEVPRDAAEWWYWWEDYNASVKQKPTEVAYTSTTRNYRREVAAEYERHSCFMPGTPIWTESGLRPIEELRAGDRVLAQHPDSGEIAFKLVSRVTAGQAASDVVNLKIQGETISPTLGHVFWVNGKGWRIAKRMGTEDEVHGVRGAIPLEARTVVPAPPIVHNLVVEDFHTYFVGKTGILVHDITERRPTQALVPGLIAEGTATGSTMTKATPSKVVPRQADRGVRSESPVFPSL